MPPESKRALISSPYSQTFELLYLQVYKTTVEIGLPYMVPVITAKGHEFNLQTNGGLFPHCPEQ